MDPILIGILYVLNNFGIALTGTISVAAATLLVSKIPRIVEWAKQKIAGTRLMMAGPAFAGKTSFMKYLQQGVFAGKTNTYTTTVLTRGGGSSWVEDNGIKLMIANCLDIPGELPPRDQVEQVEKFNPETLVVMLSLTDDNIGIWIEQFSIELASALRTNTRLRSALRSLNFVLNKSDQVPGELRSKRVDEAKKIVDGTLGLVLGNNKSRVGVVDCTLFEDQGGRQAAPAVAVKIAFSLRDKGPLFNG